MTISITKDKIDEIVANSGARSDTARKAVRKALSIVNDDVLMHAGSQEALLTTGEQVPMWKSPVLAFVTSGEFNAMPDVTLPDGRVVRAAVAAEMDCRYYLSELERKAKERGIDKIHVVTAGRRGCEEVARRWCGREQGRAWYSEISAVWAMPQLDGTTVRDPNARNPRNAKLRQLAERAIEHGVNVFCFDFGVERDNDAVTPMLVKAGAKVVATSRFYRAPKAEVPEVAPVEQPPSSVVIEQEQPEAVSA